MKNTILLILSCFLFFTSPMYASEQGYTGNHISLSPEERDWLEQHPVLRVANEDDWPPFDFSVHGEAKGFSIDVIKLIAQKIGVRLEFINGFSWEALQEKAKARELDILTSIIKTPARSEHYLFTTPYLKSPTVIVTLRENTDISRLTDVFGKTVAVVKGYYQDEYLRDFFPQIHRVYVASVLDGLKEVSYGKAEAYIGSLAVTNYEINRALLHNLKIAGESGVSHIDSLDLRFAVHKDNALLSRLLQKGLNAIPLEEMLAIQSRWAVIPGESPDRPPQVLELSPEERAWLDEHPTIRVHNETDWPPFNFFEDGSSQGLSIDYMNLLARKLGIQIEYVSGPSWAEFLNMAQRKELDVMLNIVNTEERRKYLLFTEPYALNPNVIVSRKEDRYENIEALFGKTVAFPKGFFYEEALSKHYPQIARLPVKNTFDSLKAVSFGKADAALGENAVFHYLINKNLLTDLTVSGEVDIGNPDYVNLRIGIRNDWDIFHAIVRKAMQSLSVEDMNHLRQKWLFAGEAPQHGAMTLTEEEKAWLAAHKDLRLGVDPLWPPFEFFDATRVYSGIASDYVRLFNETFDMNMQPVYGLSWPEVMNKARAGEIDVLPCLVKTPERSKFLLFTKPYLSYGMVILTRENAPFINGIHDFAPGKVAVVKGYVTQELLERDYPDSSFSLARNVEEALLSVSQGKLEAFVGNLAAITYTTEKLGLTNLKIASTMPYTFDLAFGVRKDWPELVSILNKQFTAMSPQEKSAIHSFWINIRVERQVDWRKVGIWGAVFFTCAAAIVGVILGWNRRLAQEVSKRRQAEHALRQAIDVAERANRAKSVFLANMSHELRTPLNAILGFAQIVARNPGIPAEEQEHLRIVQRNGEHLLMLINQVLDLSKIEAGQVTLTKKNFNLYQLLDDLEQLFSLKAKKKGLHLLFEREDSLPQYICTDDIKLRQVLINLLSNATKFTAEGGVTVRVCSNRFSDLKEKNAEAFTTNLHFEIEDTGPGIAPEEMDKLFEAFGQTETGKQSQEGTGLGLSISRKFAQLMGGDITVESEVGSGTTFVFDILTEVVETAAIPETLPARRITAIEPGQPRYRMLIVDDKQDNRGLLLKLLRPFGFELQEATNGQEAFEIWQHWQPDLIWMDLRMPAMDGYEATERIRHEEARLKNARLLSKDPTGSATIVLVSASSFEEERSIALSKGCDDFVRKPFRPGDIFDILHRHLGLRFVYEEEDYSKSVVGHSALKKELTPEMLTILSAECLNALKQATEEVDVEVLFEIIEQIRECDAVLADALAQLVDDFQYDEILALLQGTT